MKYKYSRERYNKAVERGNDNDKAYVEETGRRLNVIAFIFIVIFIICFARVLLDAPPLTFGGFLSTVTDAPAISVNTSLINFTITGSWGAFDFLRIFINTFISILNFIYFLVTLLINLVLSLIWVVGYIFGF